MKILCIANWKGGVAKTTTAVNLADALAGTHRVLLVDLDSQAHATLHVGLSPGKLKASLADVLQKKGTFSSVAEKVKANLHIVPSHPRLEFIMPDLYMSKEPHRNIWSNIHEVKGSYDFMVIDTPPTMNVLVQGVIMVSDQIIVPVQPDYLSLEGLARFNKVIKEMHNRKTAREFGILLTCVDRRENITNESIAQIRNHFGEAVFRTEIKRNVRLREAPSHGRSIFDYDGKSIGAKSYRAFTKEVLQRCQAA